jgi:homoserine O-acetyltransferase
MTARLEPSFEGDFSLTEGGRPFRLDAGGALPVATVRYALYGALNAARDNAILVCHALTGSARVADWWSELFGPDGALDASRHCVIGVNVLGSCYGSTGPPSVNPETGAPYGARFPVVTMRDIVRAQHAVVRTLGIRTLRCVVGGSIGGMQALQWATDFPDAVRACVAVGAAPLSAMGLALNHVQRQAIMSDPAWSGGEYSSAAPPKRGLALARMIAMCSYKSPDLFAERFGRAPDRSGEDPISSLAARFDIAGYLDYQGKIFVERFDANSYLTLSKAMDVFDLARGYASETEALKRISADVTLIGISSDWLFPAADVRALATRMRATGAAATYVELETAHGHDGFLADAKSVAAALRQQLCDAKAAV